MPKINVYLSDELAEAVKDAGLPVSPICQRALEVAVRKVAAIQETAKQDLLQLTEDDPAGRLERFTAKARTAVANGIRTAREDGLAAVGTEHLLLGIIDEGTNLAVQVLRSLEIEPDDIREDLVARQATGDTPANGAPKLDETAVTAMKAALAEAITLGHNYIGCEHLLLGLVAEPDGVAGQLLRSRGIDARAARRAVSATLSGFVYGQNRAQGTQSGAADQLREVLARFGQRLDRLEEGMARLTGEA
jgi:ATP-dependent Clp protease ATP-binding subunit ClpA